MTRSFRWLLGALLLLPSAAGAATVPIAACETTVGAGDTGVLQGDLDCSSSPYGVRLLVGATLDLGGHTITGGATTFATVLGVASTHGNLHNGRSLGPAIGSGKGDFTIVGPGGIAGVKQPLSHSTVPACVLLNGGKALIKGGAGRIDVAGCNAGVLGSSGVVGGKGEVAIEHADLHDGLYGIVVKTLTASDVTAHHTSGGIAISVVGVNTAFGVSVHDNVGNGISAGRKLLGNGVVATANSGSGIVGLGSVDLSNATSTGNDGFGVSAKRVRLTDSTLTGNGSGDVSSFARPDLTNVTCGKSTRRDGSTWGLCAND